MHSKVWKTLVRAVVTDFGLQTSSISITHKIAGRCKFSGQTAQTQKSEALGQPPVCVVTGPTDDALLRQTLRTTPEQWVSYSFDHDSWGGIFYVRT